MKRGFEAGLIQDEVSVSVSFTAFMTAVTVFFVGLLLTNFTNYSASVKFPILFLIVSTFGFLYSTLIFANTSGNIARLNGKNVHRQLLLADAMSEYLGVYLLIFSIPLVINVITPDLFLRIATLVVSLGGLIIYHVSGFSIMERQFKKMHYLFLTSAVILEVLLYITQALNPLYMLPLSIVLTLFLIILSFSAKRED